MVDIQDPFLVLSQIYQWINVNALNIITTALVIGFVILIYRVVIKEIDKLNNREILEDNTTLLIKRIFTWTIYVILGVVIFNSLGIKIDFFLGLWVLAGGTIIGFASMNTIGNAIAGIIIMVSKPFKINDRLFFQGQHVLVEDIDLIYTRMRDLDNIVISVPNQIILGTTISNHSVYDFIRRKVVITAEYSENPQFIQGILLAAVRKIDGVIDEPAPFVWITDFPNYALEYTLYYFIDDIQAVQRIEADVRFAVVNELTANGVDMSTPNLIKSIK
jgi:small conductance mechanosensitive channel